jgi:manganese/iron transport system ATP-binding protein
MGDVLVDVEGVAVELGGRRVLYDVDLRVAGGELVGLIGPNGAGKTTLLRAVLGAVPIRAGRVELLGTVPERGRGTVGYVPQRHEFAWDFPVSVRRAVMSGRARRIGWARRPGRDDHAAVDDALERVDLTGLADRPLGELSGGQRQRVLVARALALQPRLLLLDEPFAGLDVSTQTLLTRLLGELRDEGRGLVVTTHDVPHAAALCTRMCLLNRTVVADAPPPDLRDPDVWSRALGVVGIDPFLQTSAGDGGPPVGVTTP